MTQPTHTQLVLRHESTSCKAEKRKIRNELMMGMRKDEAMRDAFNWLERG